MVRVLIDLLVDDAKKMLVLSDGGGCSVDGGLIDFTSMGGNLFNGVVE